jgi:predicted ester cyclase
VEDQVAEGDTVATRWRAHGTHGGPIGGLPPTGREFTIDGVTIERFEAGRIVEVWVARDELRLMRQLGVVPQPEAVPAA